MKAGYSVYAWGIWWHTYSSSWAYIESGNQGYNTVDFDDIFNDNIKPF